MQNQNILAPGSVVTLESGASVIIQTISQTDTIGSQITLRPVLVHDRVTVTRSLVPASWWDENELAFPVDQAPEVGDLVTIDDGSQFRVISLERDGGVVICRMEEI